MEGLPTVMSVVDSGGGGGSGEQENLAFAVSEENGVNYGYIIHLPVDVSMEQELLAVGNVLDQEHLIVHQNHHQLEAKHLTSHQQSTIYLPVVSTSSSTTSSTSNNNCGDGDNGTAQLTHNHHHHHPPIQFQYHLEEIPSSAFIDGGQVQVEMSAEEVEVDVKYDTLNFTSVQLQEEEGEEDNHHVNFSDELVSEILSDNLNTSIITTTQSQQNSQVERSSSLETKPVVTTITTTTTPAPAARSYGKPKPIKLISEEISPEKKSSSSSSSSPLKVTKVNQVIVKQTQKVTAPLSVRKRRLVLDPQRQIPIPEFKRQLVNTKDIVCGRSELAPSTKKAMKCLELGGVVQFFSTPGRAIRNVCLSRLFSNHLVMISNSCGHCPSSTPANTSLSNVVPLGSDLRVPSILKDEEEDSNSNFSKGHNNYNVPSTAYKRLINLSRPLECLFKGLRKPPVFKEYKKIQRKFPEKMNGSGGGSLKSFHNRHRNKVKVVISEEDKVEDKEEPLNKVEVKVEEVVYTVVEEEGESVVLKSSSDDQMVGEEEVDSGGHEGHHDPLLVVPEPEVESEEQEEIELKKESEEVEDDNIDSSDNIFSDITQTITTSTFSMVNGEDNDDNCEGDGEVGDGEEEDDLNKLLWSSEHEQVTTSSVSSS